MFVKYLYFPVKKVISLCDVTIQNIVKIVNTNVVKIENYSCIPYIKNKSFLTHKEQLYT